jgi:hypothetical protein
VDATVASASDRSRFATFLSSFTRNEFFAVLYVLGWANGLLGRIIQSIQFSDWEGAISGIDINAIVLLACFAGISLVIEKDQEAVNQWDLVVAVPFLLLVSLPIFPLSWIAITGLSLYILVFANGNAERVRGALILLALTAPMLWSRLLFQLFGTSMPR